MRGTIYSMGRQVKLHPGQLEVAKDDSRYKVICAGRRWGKSVLSRMIVLKWALEKPGVYYIVSPTYKQAKSIHWRDLQKEVPRLWVVKKNEVEMSLTLANGSIIELKGAENPDTLRGVKLRGLVIDEIASIRSWDWLWNEVLRPTLTDYKAPAIFISTPKGYNHFHELFTRGMIDSGNYDEDYKSWKFTSYENPFIPSDEVDKARNELPEDTFEQEYMSDFRRHEGLIYKEFDRDIHTIPQFEIPASWRIFRGFDFGSNNPTVCLWVAEDEDNNLYIVDEYYERYQTTDYHAGVVKSNKLNQQVIASYGDPHGTQWLLDFQARGVYITAAEKQTGTANMSWVAFGIEKVQELLKPQIGHNIMTPHMQPREGGLPQLFVTDNCTETLKEFEAYRWKERASKDGTLNPLDVPEKADDHAMDALRYMVVSYRRRRSGRGHSVFPDDTKLFKGGFY